MCKILFVAPKRIVQQLFTDEALALLHASGEVIYNEFERTLTETELSEAIQDVDVVITGWSGGRLTRANYEAAPRLKLVVNYGQSIAHHEPAFAMDRGIRFSNAGPELALSVAEFAVGLILSGLRNIPRLDAVLRQDGYRATERVPDGYDLFGKTIGFVGFGFIGSRVAQLLKPFDAHYLVYDPYAPDERLIKLGAERVSLRDLFTRSDVITVHSGLTEETTGLIGEAELASMKQDALLVNTARAKVIVEEALLQAAKSGHIRVALDVHWQEPLPDDSPWVSLPNVVLTPHRAGGHDVDMVKRMGLFIAEDVKAFCLDGTMPRGLVTREMLGRMT